MLHFPPSVHQKIGAADMLPKLLEILQIKDLCCVQFLRNDRVRVSFYQKDVRDRYLSEGIRFGDQDIPVTRDGQNVTVVYIHDLPYEVPSDDVVDFFSPYGEVLTIERSAAAKFPNICNGNRNLKMILNQELPYFLCVCGCQCRVWYRGQLIQCFVCRERRHRAQACPLSGQCRYCHQVGHMARDCAQAWDPLPPAVDDDDSSMSDAPTVIEVGLVNNTVDKPPAHPDNSPDPKPTAELPPDPAQDNVPDADLVVRVADKPSMKVADKPPVKASDKSSEKPSAVPTDNDVAIPAPRKLLKNIVPNLFVQRYLLKYFVLVSPSFLVLLNFRTLMPLVKNGILKQKRI